MFPIQSGVELELVECQPLLEWLANNYKSFGATLEIITDKSQEGSQFVRGFGGIGGELDYLFTFTLVFFLYNLFGVTLWGSVLMGGYVAVVIGLGKGELTFIHFYPLFYSTLPLDFLFYWGRGL